MPLPKAHKAQHAHSHKHAKKVKKTHTKAAKKSVHTRQTRSMALSTDPSNFAPMPGSVPENGKPLFDKLLVANRAEIAIRVFKTCKKLGIKTVAVYSEADKDSQHVKYADEAICIGPASALESYLLPERILEACKITGAQAVHPGYGFLSENSTFAKMLEDNSIKLVGPKAVTMAEMGDKIKSKIIAKSANCLPIPGYVGPITDEQHLLDLARGIGYPCMVKAANGGGGKGMRRVNNDEECIEGYRLSLAEAKTAFNSSTMLIEKFIEDPRHIEFQVLADQKGNAIYVYERECSVQRRNQKLVEEAPSTFLTQAQREKIGMEAVAIAKKSNYENAGTVEFLMDKHGQHYYLEMNTRLQVEHPITEMISGLDLVEQQIRVAAGLPLSITQEELGAPKSWAVEARVCAEDPTNEFLPAVGTLRKFKAAKNARVDQGFIEGDEISIHYDSLLAKVITHKPTRDEAMKEMAKALDSTVIQGLATNMCFLREVMEHPKFIAGQLTTNFIADNFPNGFTGHQVNKKEVDTLYSGALSVAYQHIFNSTSTIANRLKRQNLQSERSKDLVMSTVINGEQKYHFVKARYLEDQGTFAVEVFDIPTLDAVPSDDAVGHFLQFHSSHTGSQADPVFKVMTEPSVQLDGDFDESTASAAAQQALQDNEPEILQTIKISSDATDVQLLYKGSPYQFNFYTPQEAKLMKIMPEKPKIDLSKTVLSPMPGSIFSVNVKVGDHVAAGQQLCVVEAMKMQNSIKALKPGVVKAVHVEKGKTVSGEELLIEIE